MTEKRVVLNAVPGHLYRFNTAAFGSFGRIVAVRFFSLSKELSEYVRTQAKYQRTSEIKVYLAAWLSSVMSIIKCCTLRFGMYSRAKQVQCSFRAMRVCDLVHIIQGGNTKTRLPPQPLHQGIQIFSED